MEELSVAHRVALLGFLIACVFGFVAHKANFCTMGAISDWLHMGSRGRLGAWALAAGIAVLGAQTLHGLGWIDLAGAIYTSPTFAWLGYLVGGLLFGVGMTLAAGCGQRNLVRIGGGNLKALVVVLVMGVTAYTTIRGLLGLVRINTVELANVDLAAHGVSDQGIVTLLATLLGADAEPWLRVVIAAVVGLGLVGFALAQKPLRESFDNLLAGVVIGAVAVAAWYVTGVVGYDDFDPVPLEGMTFVAPTGNTLMYLMTFTGSTIGFGIAAALGIITGSFLYAIFTGNFRIETFSARAEMVSHLVGGVLMGFGGVLALGCTIGQGVTGISTLSLGSFIALASIIFGSALTMKVQYHLMDEEGFASALREALADLLVPGRGAT